MKRTPDNGNGLVTVDVFLSVVESDDAGEFSSPREPGLWWNPQRAGDSVIISKPSGEAVLRYVGCDIIPVDLPEHCDMVRVEPTGHTH